MPTVGESGSRVMEKTRTGSDSIFRQPKALGIFSIIIAQFFLLLAGAVYNSSTFDEVMHLSVGLTYWEDGRFHRYAHNPPLVRYAMSFPLHLMGVGSTVDVRLPPVENRGPDIFLGENFAASLGKNYHQTLVIARISIILLTLAITVLLYNWGAELFGTTGGMLAACLWAFDPTALAHGCLATTDVGATLCALAAMWAFTRYVRQPTAVAALTSGILLGLAQAAKFSNLLLVPIWLAVAIFSPFFSPTRADLTVRSGHALLTLLSSLLTLNSCYFWERSFVPLGHYAFGCRLLGRPNGKQMPVQGSNRFRGTWLEKFPVPLPEYFVVGFDRQKVDSDAKKFPKFLAGEVRLVGEDGWWWYYLYCLAVKTPLGTLAIMLLSFTVGWWNGCGSKHVFAAWLCIITAVIIFVAISAQIGLNSHFRYVMPSMAFLFLWCGRLGAWMEGNRWRMLLVGCLLVANVISTLLQAPYWLSYFHELAGGPKRGPWHLVDSNLDWGQGLLALRDWRRQNARDKPIQFAYYGNIDPEHYGIDNFTLANGEGVRPGLLVVSATYITGMPGYAFGGKGQYAGIKPNGFRWLEHHKPIARLANCLYVYHLADADLPENGGRLKDGDIQEKSS